MLFVAQSVLEWKRSREFFYWRIRRRLLEENLKKKVRQFTEKKTDGQICSMMSRWFAEEKGTVNVRLFTFCNFISISFHTLD